MLDVHEVTGSIPVAPTIKNPNVVIVFDAFGFFYTSQLQVSPKTIVHSSRVFACCLHSWNQRNYREVTHLIVSFETEPFLKA